MPFFRCWCPDDCNEVDAPDQEDHPSTAQAAMAHVRQRDSDTGRGITPDTIVKVRNIQTDELTTIWVHIEWRPYATAHVVPDYMDSARQIAPNAVP